MRAQKLDLTPRTIATGVGFTEGPVIRGSGEIVFVGIDQGKVYRTRDGVTSVLAETGGAPNGATEGIDGRVYVTQTGGQWRFEPLGKNKGPSGVQAIDGDGIISWVTQDPIAPNDLCFGPDGLLYVTDPTRRAARDDGRIFRIDVVSGEVELLCSVPWYPNGIGFGIEDDALYVASSGEYCIRRFPLDRGRLGASEVFARLPFGHPDGFAFDTEGNLTASANSSGPEPGQIQTFDRNGKLIDTFIPGSNQKYPNVALSADRTLIVCDSQAGAMLAFEGWPYTGLPLHPLR